MAEPNQTESDSGPKSEVVNGEFLIVKRMDKELYAIYLFNEVFFTKSPANKKLRKNEYSRRNNNH